MAFTPTRDVSVKQVVNSIINDFTNATSIACVYVDIKGKEQSYKYNFTKFCRFIRNVPQFHNKCNQCDMNGGLETFKNHFCCPYRCHAGLVDFAVPVICQNQLNGFIVSGQMGSSDTRIPRLQAQTDWSAVNGLYREYKNVPQYRYEEIMSASRVLNTLTTCYFPFSDIRTDTMDSSLADMGMPPIVKRPEIQKTTEFIRDHLYSNLTLRSIAENVYLSESYLSTLFKQEMNVNLIQYVNQCRIIEAEKMLKTSEQSINAICRHLGYHRTSYFCKIFKKFTGETPHAYRKKHSK